MPCTEKICLKQAGAAGTHAGGGQVPAVRNRLVKKV